MKRIIDAENAVVGRLGSYVAKKLLQGDSVEIINSEKAIISGDKQGVIKKVLDLRKKGGHSLKGPKISSNPELFLKRKIRGMLPWDKPRGKNVYKKLKCHEGFGNLKEEELGKIERLKFKRPGKFVTIKQILGALK